MRRLAAQTRDDVYSSRRDYQTLREQQGLALQPQSHTVFTVRLTIDLDEPVSEDFVAFGGFCYPAADLCLTVRIRGGEDEVQHTFSLSASWNRVGLALRVAATTHLDVTLSWDGGAAISLWGFSAGKVNLPKPDVEGEQPVLDLQRTHHAPETYYLNHDQVLGMEIDEELSSEFILAPGETIAVKKCSYCGRWLPVDIDRLGLLSFHKHNTKRTRHQNECRACKKWRINNRFNPLRTTDQLHESSVITRERRLFLRDPEILQQIKDRTGAGLKSQVWERFDRKCFNCGKPLELSDVQLDHTRPLAYLWPIDEYATCLCADCNNIKKDKFPINFYNEAQLRALSRITGIEYEQLTIHALNEAELQRILAALPQFAREWDARTFAATARKICELRPDVDLFSLLDEQAPETHRALMERLGERPMPVDNR